MNHTQKTSDSEGIGKRTSFYTMIYSCVTEGENHHVQWALKHAHMSLQFTTLA
jgi:hypothetical protein